MNKFTIYYHFNAKILLKFLGHYTICATRSLCTFCLIKIHKMAKINQNNYSLSYVSFLSSLFSFLLSSPLSRLPWLWTNNLYTYAKGHSIKSLNIKVKKGVLITKGCELIILDCCYSHWIWSNFIDHWIRFNDR